MTEHPPAFTWPPVINPDTPAVELNAADLPAEVGPLTFAPAPDAPAELVDVSELPDEGERG